MSFETLVKEVTDWQCEKFPLANTQSIANHLLREARELAEEPECASEVADCFILLIGIAHKNGIDIVECITNKMTINKSRKWNSPDSQGVYSHIEETDPQQELYLNA